MDATQATNCRKYINPREWQARATNIMHELQVQVVERLRCQRKNMQSLKSWHIHARRSVWARQTMNAFQTRHACAFVLHTTFRRWMRQASRQRTREIAGRWEALAVGATVVGLDKHALSGMLSSAASVKKRILLPCSVGRHDGEGCSLASTADSSFKGRKESKFLSGMAALRVGLNPRRRLSSANQTETLGEDTRLDLSSSTDLSFDNMSRSMDSEYMRPSSPENEHTDPPTASLVAAAQAWRSWAKPPPGSSLF